VPVLRRAAARRLRPPCELPYINDEEKRDDDERVKFVAQADKDEELLRKTLREQGPGELAKHLVEEVTMARTAAHAKYDSLPAFARPRSPYDMERRGPWELRLPVPKQE
jgi:hypothetical protein